jgi:hypothetical protein
MFVYWWYKEREPDSLIVCVKDKDEKKSVLDP